MIFNLLRIESKDSKIQDNKLKKNILYTEKYEWLPGHIWIPKR
jgi:hypothetical protein